MANFNDYLDFYNVARSRNKSNEAYFKFENFQSWMVIKSLQGSGINFSGMKVLDIGSGMGGYSSSLVSHGAYVVAVDIANTYSSKVKGVTFAQADATRLPFRSNSFDFVFCSSLIEHVKNPDLLIKEIKRVLKNHGHFYLSFPPFWSPVGAHQFKPFHYLGEKIAVKLARKIHHVRSHRYDDKFGKLYIRTIRQVRGLLLKNSFKIRSISTRMSPINFAKIPILKEFLTWHVEFLLEK